MRIGVGTDFHLGLRQYGLQEREQDFYEQYLAAIDVFVDSNVDIVIMGGDIFDQPRPSPRAMKYFAMGIDKLKSNGIYVVNIAGNHGMIQAPGFVTADEFLFNTIGDEFCALLDEDTHVERSDIAIFGLPYHFNYDLDSFIEKVNRLNRDAEEFDKAILVVHQAFQEYCGFTGEPLSIDDVDLSNFDLIICGHIHDRKVVEVNDSTVYLQPGSTERSTIAEARDEENMGKGVYIVDSNKMDVFSVADGFIRIPSKRKFLISDMYVDSQEDISNMRNEILKASEMYGIAPILFLTVHDTTESFYQLLDMSKDLKSYFLNVRFHYMDESQTQEEMMIDGADIPSVRGVLKLALNPLDEEQAKLGIDLYDNLKDGNDVSGILDGYYEKQYVKNREPISSEYESEIEDLVRDIQGWLDK